jgi:hypothetical protein
MIDGGLVGSNFAGLNSLEWLVLDGNLYNAPIPKEIGQLDSLEYFYAAGAMITGDLSYMENMTAIFEHWVDGNPELVSRNTIRTSDIALSLIISNSVFRHIVPNNADRTTW